MTREQAIERLNRCREILEITSHMDNQNRKAFDIAIKALEQKPILNKIRAEIDLLSDSKCDGNSITIYSWNGMKRKVFDIIDKYKAESEGK